MLHQSSEIGNYSGLLGGRFLSQEMIDVTIDASVQRKFKHEEPQVEFDQIIEEERATILEDSVQIQKGRRNDRAPSLVSGPDGSYGLVNMHL